MPPASPSSGGGAWWTSRNERPGGIRVAVIGVGHLGRHHARILSTLPDVELVGVVDSEPPSGRRRSRPRTKTSVTARCRRAARPGRCRHRRDADRVACAGRAAVAASAACRCWSRSRWRARSTEADDADRGGASRACDARRRPHRAVQSGRAAARALLTTPRFIEVHRLGTFPDRSLDIDVVFDLMIHDLDVVLSIVGSPVVAIDAVGVPVLTPKIDIANVRLRFENGLHRQPHREPHQPRSHAQDPLFSAGLLRVDRLRGAGARGVAARPAAGRPAGESKAASCPCSRRSR